MNIFISAGDHSGDIHAANLVKALRSLNAQIHVEALGGENLKSAANQFNADLVSLGGFGFWQPIKQYFKLRDIFKKQVENAWLQAKPDIVVLVDYYGFNIHIARLAKQRAIPVYYFVGPQVWASRPWRIKQLKRTVTKMLLILPFEEAIYRKADVPAVFVGNPMVDTVPEALSAPERGTPKRYDMPQARQRQSPDVGGIPYVGLFAGSRPNVLKRHIPILLEAAKLIENETRAHFAFFASKNTAEHFYSLPYPVVIEDDYRERQKLTIAITTSGTVSLENALLGIPMVVMYRLSGFNYAVAKLLVSIPHIAMANILTNKELVPELIQNRANAKDIASASLRFLKDDSYYFAVRKELLAIREMLGAPGIYERTAKIILGKT